uniref:Ig-like domain-containing protein n=1 Tax=Esox lucius TaxID=8010 RepID=A0A3P8ZA73_ESOLU
MFITGQTVTLNTGLTGLQKHMIYWTYDPAGSETIIATLNVRRNRPEYNERLHLDAQSGSLTIKSLTTNDHGLYEMEVIRLQPLTQTFHLIIYAPVSVPNIRCITQSRSVDRLLTKESFSLVCSVKNGRDVILSWYRGEDIINQTSSRDPNITLYLPLEVKEGNETYRCVANNPVSKQTTKLRIEDHCQQHTGTNLLFVSALKCQSIKYHTNWQPLYCM